MFYLYARRPSTDTLTTISSLTTTTTDEEETDVRSLFSISIRIDTIEEQNIQHLAQVFRREQAAQKAKNAEQKKKSFGKQIVLWFMAYLRKFSGLNETRPKRIAWHEYFWSFIGSFLGILIVAFMHYRLLEPHNLSFLIGSFGASAVLIYGTPNSPLAQPRNVIGGHFLSAIVGCVWRVAIYRFEHSVTVALAVATSIVVMQFTETVHPPGGATALIAVTTQPLLPWANFLYIFVPVLAGSITMLIVALIVNNLSNHRTYPASWW